LAFAKTIGQRCMSQITGELLSILKQMS
jgi:protein-S-isoprenylcysteine O-methyltransferase Ste14